MDTIDRLEKLAALHKSGALTGEEFEAQKRLVLASGNGAPAPLQPLPDHVAEGPAGRQSQAIAPADDDAIDAFSGLRAGFFMSLLYLWYGFAIAVKPSLAGVTPEDAPYSIALTIPAVAMLLGLGHLSSSRHSLIASGVLLAWAGFDLLANLGNLIQERDATFFLIGSLLFAGAAAYQAFDAIRFAWAVRQARATGEPLPEMIDRTGAGQLLTSQVFWALLFAAIALMAILYLWFGPA